MIDTIGKDITGISEIIRLAMAPSFLLLATGAILQLFAGRLARVIDRERMLVAAFHSTSGEEHAEVVRELRDMDKRARVVNLAILLAVLSAIMVCVLIAALFVMGVARTGFVQLLSGGFIVAMMLLIAGLICFLIEVRLAARNIRVQEALLELD